MNINVCIPTLRRYDLLEKLIESGERGNVVPTHYYIIDNGGSFNYKHNKVSIFAPGINLGVATSWNWFCKNVSEIRIIMNDDIELLPDTIEKMVDFYIQNPNEFVYFPYGSIIQNVFSLYLITDNAINLVGLFDELFYPAYFEDNDYTRRLNLLGKDVTKVPDCSYNHYPSSTMATFNFFELEQHHSQFKKNKEYYIKKWGGEPGHETYTTPFNKR